MSGRVRAWWQTFTYNFCWSDYVSYIDGWIPRLSLTVPIVGYLILFNDTIGQAMKFAQLTGSALDSFGLTGQERLRCVYFGLIALGLGNFVYRLKRPYVFRHGTNASDFVRNGLEFFTLGDFIEMHHAIRREHLTRDGKYYDSEWDGFRQAATDANEGRDDVQRTGSWEVARTRYGSLLRSILRETFFRADVSRRIWLVLCLFMSTIGYVLLAIPSVDLFVKVIASSVTGE